MHAIAKQKSPVNSIFEILVGRHTTNFWLQKVNPLWSMHQPLGKIIEKNPNYSNIISLDDETPYIRQSIIDYLINYSLLSSDIAYPLCDEIMDYIKLRIKHIKKEDGE